MTMTRQQLEDVIERQLAYQHAGHSESCIDSLDASRRAILAAADDWAASQAAAAVTPPAPPPCQPDLDAIRWMEDPSHGPSRPRTWRCWRLTFWTRCPHRAHLARALDTTTGGTR